MSLPGLMALYADGERVAIRSERIPHKKILLALQDSEHGLKNLAAIYREKVLPNKTRSIPLLGRKCTARITQTLLGYEVKASYKRIHCPDLVTARYLKIFAALGCRRIRLPYDPSITARLVPELELGMEALATGVRNIFPDRRRIQLYVLRNLYRILRQQLQ
jgi:hypothetical protein